MSLYLNSFIFKIRTYESYCFFVIRYLRCLVYSKCSVTFSSKHHQHLHLHSSTLPDRIELLILLFKATLSTWELNLTPSFLLKAVAQAVPSLLTYIANCFLLLDHSHRHRHILMFQPSYKENSLHPQFLASYFPILVLFMCLFIQLLSFEGKLQNNCSYSLFLVSLVSCFLKPTVDWLFPVPLQ